MWSVTLAEYTHLEGLVKHTAIALISRTHLVIALRGSFALLIARGFGIRLGKALLLLLLLAEKLHLHLLALALEGSLVPGVSLLLLARLCIMASLTLHSAAPYLP